MMHQLHMRRTSHAIKTMWPHLAAPAAAEMLETVLEDFGE